MLVSHRYRFIYTKTLKTASTSVESYFERFCMPEGAWEQVHARDEYESPDGIIGFRGADMPSNTKWWNHMPAADIRKHLGDKVWNSYFKFCVVRNPYEKCISAFEHFGKDNPTKTSSILVQLRTRGMSDEQRQFFNYLRHSAPIDRDKYTLNGKFCLDDVIRFESLEAEIKRVCKHLGLPFEPALLPTFKSEYRRSSATIEELFTPAAMRQVQKRYAYEIKRFGYSAPSS